MKNKIRISLIIGLLFILTMINIGPTQANQDKKDTSSQQILSDNENILADIIVTWDSFFHRFSFKDLAPNITINQSDTTDFYFSEINNTIQMNFTIICKHRLENPVIIRRLTRIYLAISYNDSYLFLAESINHRCKNLTWEYINFTIDPSYQLIPLLTNGENKTLTVEVGVFGFPFGTQGVTLFLNSIIVHPIPTSPR